MKQGLSRGGAGVLANEDPLRLLRETYLLQGADGAPGPCRVASGAAISFTLSQFMLRTSFLWSDVAGQDPYPNSYAPDLADVLCVCHS